jgi:hypothetical protein
MLPNQLVRKNVVALIKVETDNIYSWEELRTYINKDEFAHLVYESTELRAVPHGVKGYFIHHYFTMHGGVFIELDDKNIDHYLLFFDAIIQYIIARERAKDVP